MRKVVLLISVRFVHNSGYATVRAPSDDVESMWEWLKVGDRTKLQTSLLHTSFEDLVAPPCIPHRKDRQQRGYASMAITGEDSFHMEPSCGKGRPQSCAAEKVLHNLKACHFSMDVPDPPGMHGDLGMQGGIG